MKLAENFKKNVNDYLFLKCSIYVTPQQFFLQALIDLRHINKRLERMIFHAKTKMKTMLVK
jgi:hypothetical protein